MITDGVLLSITPNLNLIKSLNSGAEVSLVSPIFNKFILSGLDLSGLALYSILVRGVFLFEVLIPKIPGNTDKQ